MAAALLRDPPDPVIVYGAAGIGKTTLALEAAHHPEVVGLFKERRAFVPLDKALDDQALLAATRSALALPPSPDPWDRLERLLEPAPALLVLDSLEVPGSGGARGRGRAQAARRDPDRPAPRVDGGGQPPVKPSWKLRLEVGALAPPHAQELLLDVAGDIDPGSPFMPTVLDALGGVPLAIELFAAQAAGLGDLGLAWRQWAKRRVGC